MLYVLVVSGILPNLINLKQVWLANCQCLSVPIVLEQMTHLQCTAVGHNDKQVSMQITRPLSFLTSFPEQPLFVLSSISEWDPCST